MGRPFPPHLLSDEKHTWWQGERVYVATTVGEGCILGAQLSVGAGSEALQEAYRVFAQEARELDSHYSPQTLNTDGWEATQNAWRGLFAGVNLILCFLHSVLAIGQRCRLQGELWQSLQDKLWNIYHAPDAAEFIERLRHLQAWAIGQNLPESVMTKILNLSVKASHFTLAYQFPEAHRTSNMLDRLMNYQDRVLFAMQYFHGYQDSANLTLRAMAMLWNFHPYGRRSQSNATDTVSPFEELNGFYYHHNWLRNFLTASSINGRGGGKFRKHTISQN
ncbi:hypothetical protein K9N68_39615 (plasmid) [Kovacikia minuta CCNUW1]|uniref:hypothetical protein n=1 Tax=Kovacikia minuta TaxID=2931930 RepID=UPI001CCA329C|nr:hypothetical protein [Kovacikia minuta]UBF24131.1 hypothetical protein K9N68_20685 [Kovacikia minuta CCNUW1]UBF25686.1 hypothetical protein K9N68_29685 [Kovacikia minuta CCNUW1]UBF28704.1 hypothetical protein K9N68_13145 [Kovacikia minuta CCNUW1]UBF30228.1 hypothetical protein K9N68_39615 [Kovacikia minuta CCNUW1]